MMDISNIQQDFGQHLFNFIKTRVTCYEDAQDIYQDAIFKLLNNSDKLKNPQSLKSWLFTIARNQIIDYYRTAKISENVDALPARLAVPEEDAGAYQELEACVHIFINALPPDYKEVVLLSEIEGKSQKEIAQNLNLNYVTVRSKVQRGRQKIRKMIFDACIVGQDKTGGPVECTPKASSPTCSHNGACGCNDQ